MVRARYNTDRTCGAWRARRIEIEIVDVDVGDLRCRVGRLARWRGLVGARAGNHEVSELGVHVRRPRPTVGDGDILDQVGRAWSQAQLDAGWGGRQAAGHARGGNARVAFAS